ncbi:phage portal protein [Patescibacteria group bacterium]|nr:phage portal protein [Patescibacteria group bacterium]
MVFNEAEVTGDLMGIVAYLDNKIRNSFLRYALRGKTEFMGTGGWDTIMGTDAWQDASDVWRPYSLNDLEKLFGTNGVVNRCISKIYTVASEADLQIVNSDLKPMPNHPLLKLMQNPNPSMSYSDFLGHFLSHAMLTGESYIWEVRNRAGLLDALLPIPTSWVTKKYDQDRRTILYYEVWQGQGPRARVLPMDMTVLKFINPSNPTEGLGPLQAAIKEVQTDEERQDYMIEMLVNVKSPGMTIYQEEDWTPAQKRDTTALLNDLIGKGRRGNPLFIGGTGAKVEMIAPLKDLDWPGLTNLSETRICTVFGVPPIIIGLRSGLERATYANYEQADRSFYRGTMIPIWRMLENAFTRGFIFNEQEQQDLKFMYDLSGVMQLQEDQTEVASRAVTLFHGGLITRNRARELTGEEPIVNKDVGDVLLQPMNLIETRIDGKPTERQEAMLEEELDTDPPEEDMEEVDGDEDVDEDVDADVDEDGKTFNMALTGFQE